MVHNPTVTVTCPSSYWRLAGYTDPPLVTLGQSGDLRSANNEQSIMHARSALTTHPSLPFPSIFRAFCSDYEHWTMFVLVATTALLFSSFSSYSSFNLSRLFLPHQAIQIIIVKKQSYLHLQVIFVGMFRPWLPGRVYIHGNTTPDRGFAWQQLINGSFITRI